jgi:hypothetical protein
MTAVLILIWEFILAAWPTIVAISATAVEIWRVLFTLAKVTAILTLLYGVFEILFDPKGKQRVGNLLANLVGGALAVARPLLQVGEVELAAIVHAFAAAFKNTGPLLAGAVVTDIQDFAKSNLNAIAAQLHSVGESTPANAVGTAGIAFGEAFGLGMGSAAVTAAFEALLPERLNTLNGVGPMLAEMAGFKEIAGQVLDPLYHNAFGRSLEYQYRSTFKPELPSEDDAVTWHSRRLLSEAQLRVLFAYSGLKAEYEEPFIQSAYRAVQPRALASLLIDSPFPTAEVRGALEFAGIRPADVTFLLGALEASATRNVRQQYLAAAVRSTELGTMTPAELGDVLHDINYSADAAAWVQLTVATRKLEQLAELYRRSISEAYQFGTITDAQYVPSLEAIGIAEADARAHYAVDSIKKHGRELLAQLRAEERLTAQRLRAAVAAAIASFKSHVTDAVALEAALLAAGLDPIVATFTVATQELRRDKGEVFIYGLELPRSRALLLRENVSALKAQTTALLLTPAQALAALRAYGIPAANAEALVAEWEAGAKHKPASPILLPR